MNDSLPSGWLVYMLECAGGRLYTGITNDLAKRLAAHRAGRGARFTRMHPPRAVVACLACASRAEASAIEVRLKRLPRPDKLAWAAAHPVQG